MNIDRRLLLPLPTGEQFFGIEHHIVAILGDRMLMKGWLHQMALLPVLLAVHDRQIIYH